jgi:hypothetical protein
MLHREPAAWEVLIKDHHDGYISWQEFERNQRLIADNVNGKSYLGRSSIRQGGALLPDPLSLRTVRQEVSGILWRVEGALAALRVPGCIQRTSRSELHRFRWHVDRPRHRQGGS